MSHESNISDDALAAYLLGECDDAGRAAVNRAAATSASIAARLAGMQAAIGLMREARRVAADFSVEPERLKALRALTPKANQTMAEVVETVVRHIATLIHDSWSQPAPAGYRGVSAERLIRFTFPGGGVDLQIIADAATIGRFWIVGNAEGMNAGRVVAQSASTVAASECDIRPDGYFELFVQSGPCTLEIQTPSGLVVIGPIEVGRR